MERGTWGEELRFVRYFAAVIMPNFPQPTLVVLCLALASASGVAALRTTTGQRRVLLFAAMILLVTSAFYFRASRLAFEKLATTLTMPPGLVWLGLIVAIAVAARRKQWLLVWLTVLCWLLLTLAGNSWVSYMLLAHLEHDYRAIDPLAAVSRDEPLDVVVTLGGGTTTTPAGQVQLTNHGDRVLLAARIYHQGGCRRLMATGRGMDESAGDRLDPAEETVTLWRDLAVPNDAIHTIGGRTTHEEMLELAKVAEEEGWRRIGVVTSAFHMARAERLAREAGLDVLPLPARFLAEAPSIHLLSPVPTGECLEETSFATKELLAGLVGR